ncbi:hypothetical protein RB614_22945 [Phytohabitans sp. ZYX-F-186]|uniref:Uncharacterized protein n=1 Tax=Phytohabitans maris TaxID=3071409 RepID=A0ABU0ZK02_9ACTN|nr:hypothetical protein [Phytohabitans sp. ZYX-F-186]MDQ7907378.1 hypothetical protein [Phytohabitans sp. ZYX-F-186]
MTMDGDRWLSATAAERRARTAYRYRTDAEALRDAWRAGAAEQGWEPRDWWAPGVDAVARALVAGRAATPAFARLGRERAQAGYGVREVLADVHTLYQPLTPNGPPAQTVRALLQGWASVRLAPVRVILCTSYATADYLRDRLFDLYPQTLPHGLAVIAVDAPGAGSEWEALTLLLEAGARTPTVFAAEAPITRTSPHRVLALVRTSARGPLRRAGLRNARLIPLPHDLPTAANLIAQVGEDQD